jgi:NAD(P)-dependent dehydrogenase (short-subunit alcohol dehydrogenase family)
MGVFAITGSASGIGRATKAKLEAAGHRAFGIDRHDAEIVADLSTPSGRRAAVDTVGARVGRLDGAVACAGLGLPSNGADRIVAVNFFGAAEFLEGLRPLLAAAESAKAVVVSSNSSAIIPDLPPDLIDAMLAGDEERACRLARTHGELMAYCSSKFAIARWVRRTSVSTGWAGTGIRLNAIAPGVTRTPMFEATQRDPVLAQSSKDLPIPLVRHAEAGEMAALIEVLLSPVADYMVGQIIYLDGGTEALLRQEHWPARWSHLSDARSEREIN